jgi:simple sugar transport system permease protein
VVTADREPAAVAPGPAGPPPPGWLDLLVGVGVRALAVLLVVVAVALAWAAIVVAGGGELASVGRAVAGAGLLHPDALAAVASAAAPLLLAGLAAAIALRAGLVNLGVLGQALAGAAAALVVAERVQAPAPLLLPLVALTGMGAGLAWALPPALLRAWRGVPELLTTVLASYLAVAVVGALPPAREPPRVPPPATVGNLAAPLARLAPGASWPALLTWTVPLAVVAALAWAFVLHCTEAGPRLRALAAGEARAARIAGVRAGVTAVAALLLSGAVAGLAGLQDVLGQGAPVSGGLGAAGLTGLAGGLAPADVPGSTAPLALAHLPDYGLLAIAVALGGRGSSLGMAAAALALALLDRAGLAAGPAAGLAPGSVAILQAALVVAAVGAARVARGLTDRWDAVQLRRRAPAPEAVGELEQAPETGTDAETTEGARA